MVGTIGSAIRRLGGEGGDSAPRYNFIHLRIENDWVAHCRWAKGVGMGRGDWVEVGTGTVVRHRSRVICVVRR